ncbi:MAG: amino acid permease [Bacteroidetes bacterium]|nr:amino acid permease [Bacteroidota bacterium]
MAILTHIFAAFMAERKIDLLAATSIVVANMIGTGVFVSLGYQLFGTTAGFPILAIWLVGGLLAFLGALSYAELATRLPEDGGEYYFLSKIYHPALGFMAGFVSSTVGFAAPIAAAALALGAYLKGVFPGINETLVAGVIILAIAIIHMTNLKAGVSFQKVFTIIKVAIIVIFIAIGCMQGNVQNISFSPEAFYFKEIINPAFAVSLVWVSFAYSGWNASAYIAGEIKNPGKNISRSILGGAALVTILYVLINSVFMMSTPASELVGKKEVGLVASNYIFGNNGGKIMGAIISILLISTISSMILAGPRVLQSMFSKIRGLQYFSERDSNGNPTRAILFQTILSLILMLTVNFDSLINYIAFTLSLFTILTVSGIIVLRFRHGKPQGYRAFGYPVTPVIFILTTLAVAIYFMKSHTPESLLGLGTALLGGLLYFISTDKKKIKENDQ